MTEKTLFSSPPQKSAFGICHKQSELLTCTTRHTASEDVSRNAQILTQGGFVNRLMAGVYTFLPLGARVLGKIENVIRHEMASVGASEILMPALQPKEVWEQTGRWDTVDVLYKFKGQNGGEVALGPTHEEVVTPLIASFIQSYKDLPLGVFQIQTKFRNEARAKSGLLRGREFRMKDLYSFHLEQEDLDRYYDNIAEAYKRIYERCGIGSLTYVTFASGGMFSKYSHEFQTVTPYGEDTIYCIPYTKIAINKEIITDENALREILPPGMTVTDLQETKAIEVGNIFKLGTRFSEAFNFSVTSPSGTRQPVLMGCYGLGSSRVMGTIVECLAGEKSMVWPKEVAPYAVHVLSLAQFKEEQSRVEEFIEKVVAQGVEVLCDDRLDVRPGEKFAESDLFGIPIQVVLGKKSFTTGDFEVFFRESNKKEMLSTSEFFTMLSEK